MRKAGFKAHIRGGRVRLTHPAKFAAFAQWLGDGEAIVTLERPSPGRSTQANRYYFGRVVQRIGDELGYADPEEMHELIAFKFLRIEDDEVTGAPRRTRTRDMTSAEFSDYVTRVITWAETDLHIRIPRPGEIEE